jgi:hypothetical protein
MKILLTAFFLISIFLSCREATESSSFNNRSSLLLSNPYRYDTLTLYARYKDCGEWGGHTEVFKIYKNDNKEMWANYKKDSANCNSPISRKVSYERSLKLTADGQILIIQYMHDLLDLDFSNDPVMSNAGEYYSVFSSDSSLVISHYTSSFLGFDKLREKILH